MSREVKKIDGLDFGFSASTCGVRISFIGTIDAVRLAARDLVYGLEVLWKIDSRIHHVSEHIKMEGQSFPDGHAQIDLVIVDLSAFACLVTVFRYLMQLGFTLPEYKSSLFFRSDVPMNISWQYPPMDSSQPLAEPIKVGNACSLYGYIDAIKQHAMEYSMPLIIPDYPLQFNRCFWLESELMADAEKRLAVKNGLIDTNTFFGASCSSDTSGAPHSIQSIDRKMEFILSEISVLEMRHPLNPNYASTKGDAYCCVNNYLNVTKEHPGYDLMKDEQKIFSLIRRDDKQVFFELAEEYRCLQEQRQQLSPPAASRNNSTSCLIL